MTRQPWHRRLEARVLLGVTLVVGVSLLAVLLFTRRAVTRSSEDRAGHDLNAAREAFNRLVDARAEFAARQTRLVTELPIFQSLLGNPGARSDPPTVNQLADQYCRRLEADFCVVTDHTGLWIGRASFSFDRDAGRLDRAVAAARTGRSLADVVMLERALFLIAAEPAIFGGQEVLGTLIVGYRLDDAVASELSLVAHGDVSFLCGDTLCASSLPLGPRGTLEAALKAGAGGAAPWSSRPALKKIGDTSYFGGLYPLDLSGADQGGLRTSEPQNPRTSEPPIQARLLLLQDWTPTERAVDQIHTALLWIGSATFLVALAGGIVFSRVMTRPLRELASVADEVAGGHWARRVPVDGPGEARTMAEAFNRMTGTLSHWHREATERANELQGAYDRFRAVTDSTNDAIVSINRRGEIVFWNLRAQTVFGYSEAEAIGQPLTFIMPERYRFDYAEEMARLLAGESRWLGSTVELTGLGRDGAEVPVELSLSAWKTGQETLYTAVIRDITERRQAAEALRQREEQLRQAQKMEAVGRLAGGVAHDFNNLLTAMLGYADLLINELPDGQPHKDAEEIQKAGRSAASLIRDLLAFSRKQVLQPVVLELNAIVASTENLLRRLIGEHIELALELDEAAGAIRADRSQLEQVLINLAVNARDAMPSGGRLVIRTSAVAALNPAVLEPGASASGPHAVLTVSDTGEGMSEATRARIFEPFFTTKPVGKGTGLGLATVYGIVKQSGGQIWVTSAPGKGASFSVALPTIDDAVEAEREAEAAPPVTRQAELVLLVEDNDSVRSLARETLARAGYRVLEARHGQEALAVGGPRLAELSLVITDVVMPLMGGRELAKALTAWRPDLKVIFTSGYVDERAGGSGDGRGWNGCFLQKPFTPASLGRAVRDVLDTSPRLSLKS